MTSPKSRRGGRRSAVFLTPWVAGSKPAVIATSSDINHLGSVLPIFVAKVSIFFVCGVFVVQARPQMISAFRIAYGSEVINNLPTKVQLQRDRLKWPLEKRLLFQSLSRRFFGMPTKLIVPLQNCSGA
jgi:hypothetical protein